ncbi:hypothetical protein D0Z00_004237 [Geotrichum galactomycetum]|uniref:Uncharacterized protein n=1 Tax=Geotrichum galactomycetum TaxID=27317 RepID=A0ACB6UZ38_9ASCO|nr:hypothetical protein D0Z00_004237 [Geotrichum candidum]
MVLAAVGQFCATSSVAANAAIIKQLVHQASAAGARVLFLPEASDYIASTAEQSVALAQPVETSAAIQDGVRAALRELPAGAIRPHVSIGVHEPSDTLSADGQKKRLKNTLLWFDPNGQLLHRYQKIHLFDVDISNGPILKESNSVEPGHEVLAPFDSPIGKIGAGICYDIRFPELALRQRSLGAEVLLFPSAFTVKTGAAHWEVLARARAIDTQCYVIMAALTGVHDPPTGKRQSYGHSIIVDPWGTVLAQAPDIDTEPRIITADIDLAALKKGMNKTKKKLDSFLLTPCFFIVRENMPLWSQRRPDVFGYTV